MSFRRALRAHRRRVRGRAATRLAAVVGLALALVLALPALGKEPDKKGGASKEGADPAAARTWYAATFARSGDEFRIVHYWSKGRLFRAESMVAGHPLITIVNGPLYYTIDLLAGQGVAIERSKAALADDAKGGRPFATELEDLKAGGGEKIRTEMLADVEVDVWQLTDTEGRRRIWATQDKVPVPIRIETWDRQSNRTGELAYSGWLVGLLIPDSFFEPPPNIELQRMTYDEYLGIGVKGPAGPAPVLYRHLLHGRDPKP